MQQTPKSLKLATRLIIGALVLLIAPALAAGVLFSQKLKNELNDMVLAQMIDRTEMAREQLTGRLDQLWHEVKVLSTQVQTGNPEQLRERLTLLSQVDNRFNWLGFADVSGRVIASSNGMLEDANVAQRPWFARGLEAPFAGDVHEAVLLKNLLPMRDEPYRFIDFSAPVRDADGKTIGVLGAHMDWKWVKGVIHSFQSFGKQALLISQNQQILHGPIDSQGAELSGGLATAAASGARIARAERWADGKTYLTVALPVGTAADAPSFGWSLVLRQEADAASVHAGSLLRDYVMLAGIAVLVSLFGMCALIISNAAPITRVSRFASTIADEIDAGVPPDPVGCAEAVGLTNALTKLQSRLGPETVTRLRRAG
ncbi:MAG: cache domain-containing protein [Rhodomicrobiaceae bacterium]